MTGGGGSGGSGGGGGSGGMQDMAMICGAPADCPNATPVCCMNVGLGGGTVPNCTTTTITIDCQTETTCPTKINASCTGSQVVHLCKSNSDCTEGMYNLCCEFSQGTKKTHFCANDTLAVIGGGQCM
jgi:hypothetical protein